MKLKNKIKITKKQKIKKIKKRKITKNKNIPIKKRMENKIRWDYTQLMKIF